MKLLAMEEAKHCVGDDGEEKSVRAIWGFSRPRVDIKNSLHIGAPTPGTRGTRFYVCQ